MRSIFIVSSMFVMGAAVGCADILGIEPWEDPQEGKGGGHVDSSSGQGGQGGQGSTSSDGVDACHNLVQDGLETGIDCGGGECNPCANLQGCLADADCSSQFCPESRGYCITDDGRAACGLVAPENPTCGDCVKNGMETDVDCGGECFPCRQGKTCTHDGECWSGLCSNGICAPGGTNTRCYSNDDCLNSKCMPATATCTFESCCE